MSLNIFKLKKTNTRCGKQAGARRGVAALECAIVLPFILIIMTGTLEICSGIYLKESLTICAFEGVRVGVRRRGTADMVNDRVQEVLAERQIVNASVTVLPTDFASLAALDPITVIVEAPANGNTAFNYGVMTGRTVAASVSFVREFDE
jgi:Flp pilus assembly protein TadG